MGKPGEQIMKLDQMLGEFLASSPCPTDLRPDNDLGPRTCLPASVQDWPLEWRQNYETAVEAIERLLPIDAFYAEAAAEIAIRQVFDCQYNPAGGGSRPFWEKQ